MDAANARPLDVRQTQPPAEGSVTDNESVSEQRWHLVVHSQKNPNNTIQVTIYIRRDGQILKGFAKYDSWPGTGTLEIRGKIDEAGAFAFVEEGGVNWSGRLLSDHEISGFRDNAAWPFNVTSVDQLPVGTIVFPKAIGPTSDQWGAFFAQFKTAVRNRDTPALKRMMSTSFEYGDSFHAAPEQVFKDLDWGQLERTLSLGTSLSKPSAFGRPTRAAINRSPCKGCTYEVFVSFVQDDDNQWRWSAITFPGD
jgi:hypothetical protein